MISTDTPTVGKLFFSVAHVGPANCTATVINDSNSNSKLSLVLTAAHCIETAHACFLLKFDDYMFGPKWHDNTFPLGEWFPQSIWVDKRWVHQNDAGCWSEDPRYDYAVIVMKQQRDSTGTLRGVGWFTGVDGWKVPMPARKDVRIVGIPGNANDPLKVVTESHIILPNDCNFLARTASTPGFSTGASGGPWIYRYNFAHQFGYLLGIISGCGEGGPNANTSYSSVWNINFAKFVNWVAAKHE